MDARRRLVEQTLLLTAAHLSALAVGFYASVLTARALGPDGRGVFAWITTLVGIAIQIATLAPNQVVRAIAPEFGADRAFVPTLLALGPLGAALGLPLLAYGIAAYPADSSVGLLLAAWITVPLVGAGAAMATIVQIQARPLPVILSLVGPKAVLVLATAFLWWNGRLDLAAAVWLYTGSVALQFAVVLALVGPARAAPSFALLRRVGGLLGAGWIAALAVYAIPRVSLVVLGSRGLLAEAGYYSVALTMYEIMIVLPVIASGVLTTHLSQNRGSHAGRRTALIFVGSVGGPALVAAVAAEPLIRKVFGDAFAPAVMPFRGLLAAVVLATVYQLLQSTLVLRCSPLAIAAPPLTGLFVALGASWFVVPAFGTAGAVAATLLGCGALVLASLALLRAPSAPPS
jgi:O-antigen/teichoic acid export membrane protein